MTSPGQQGEPSVPNPSMLARQVDDGSAAEQAISAALARLDEVRELPVAEHVERFEAVHSALSDALSKAENMHSGPTGGG
ncbi:MULTISPECIES: hypothetical protein [unclassified Saccharopolyspora]|uniref:hypothetical protein n=1 Tax=unclassified Saccharopolyspora TaxID=2646250 RepID=UPI0025D02D23|nr:hypothetical protein [Saccharopolyspora sp.]